VRNPSVGTDYIRTVSNCLKCYSGTAYNDGGKVFYFTLKDFFYVGLCMCKNLVVLLVFLLLLLLIFIFTV